MTLPTRSLVPENEEHDYASLPAPLRMELDYIDENIASLLGHGSLLRKCRDLATTIGIDANALYGRVRRYRKTGDWRDLTNRAKAGKAFWKPSDPGNKPACFREFVKSIFERFQRNDRQGYNELLLIWRTRTDSEGKTYAHIPGYSHWPSVGPSGDHPDGWSYRNLSRFSPCNYDKAAVRQGLFSSSAFRPPVITTRVGLDFCRRVQFDDHEHNLKVHFPGQPKAMRPRSFWAAEGLSAFLTPVWKPTFWDAENEVKKTLTKRDFMWFAIFWMTQIGYRTDGDCSDESSPGGTWMVIERGTAEIDEEFQKRIFKATNGCVKISRPAMFNKPAHGGQFGGKGAGNFKHKPLIESSFNLVDNVFSALPGQTGLDRLTSPEDMGKREQYFGNLLRAASEMPGERAEKLILPFLTWREFADKAIDLAAAINANTGHEIEGWLELGFHAKEFRLPCGDGFTPWQRKQIIDAMPEGQRTAMELVLAQNCGQELTRARNLSRKEVFDGELARARKAGAMKRLSPWRYHDLLGMENSIPVTVGKNHLFKIDAREISVTPLHFEATVNHRHLDTGEKYRLFVNPWDTRVALLCRDDGRAEGLVQQWDQPSVEDAEGIKRMMGRQAHWEAEQKGSIAVRHQSAANAVQHMRDHNDALIHPGQKTAAERDEQKRLDREAAKHAEPLTDDRQHTEPSTEIDPQLEAMRDL